MGKYVRLLAQWTVRWTISKRSASVGLFNQFFHNGFQFLEILSENYLEIQFNELRTTDRTLW